MRIVKILLVALLMVFPGLVGSGFAQIVAATDRIEVAQQRTLFDLLFGPREQTPPTQIRRTPAAAPHVDQPRVVAPQAAIAQIPDAVEKVEDATRLAIFGDSMAIDLAKAFQREFAMDENLVVVGLGVGSSGFVRDDFYDWNAALGEEIAADNFDLAVIIIGINDRQAIGGVRPLSDEWKVLYRQRIDGFLAQLGAANKPVVWVGLPPMRSVNFSAQISEISSIHRLAAFAAGIEFVDIYDRFAAVDGKYALRGPNLNGEDVVMRKNDGIHFSAAGSDKLVFFINQVMRLYYDGGAIRLAIADPLEGTDASGMARPPFQGNGEFRLLQVAGAVMPLSIEPVRALELILAPGGAVKIDPVDAQLLMQAPVGRADDFGVGIEAGQAGEDEAPLPQ